MYKRDLVDKGIKLTYDHFKEISLNWFGSCSPVLVDQPLERYILDSILEYTELYKNSNSSEKIVIDAILTSLRAKLNTICPVDSSEMNKPKKLAAGLHNIFDYYAKKQKTAPG